MPQTDTLIFRVALAGQSSTYREIEIEAEKSLYQLAKAINLAFDFAFDHAFGFYSGLTQASMLRKHPMYELFADMGDANPGVVGVKRTKVAQAFPEIGHKLLFLFDYGDEWHFLVTLKGRSRKAGRVRYPRLVASRGAAPEQYPAGDADEEGPTFGINPVTGEKFYFGKK
jgi:hypothetical protein